ncbi:MAG: ABC transporter ATP-binding protein [Burkholderiaceae bacterium]|nr:MAG: ABC transporter ATP-binding protein [Burkholderiaceae bacterium]
MATLKKSWTSLLLIAAALVLLPHLAGHFGNSWIRILDFALLYLMLALGLNIVVGFAGLLDLGYIAFYAVGAYLYALLASPHLTENFEILAQWFPQGLHLSIWLVLPLCAGFAALFGILLGTPVLKLRGDYLAIVTLGFGEIIRIFLNNLNAPVNITNGPQGINLIDPLRIGGVDLSRSTVIGGVEISGLTWTYYVFLALALLIVFVCLRLQDSRIGRAWLALREDELAAKAMGINTRNIKLLAFAMGASFAGVAGALFAAFQGFVSPESFSLMESIVVLAMVVLGGMGHIPGVVLGALLLAALPEALRHWLPPLRDVLIATVSPWFGSGASSQGVLDFIKRLLEPEVFRSLIFGLAMVGIMLLRPKGLWPSPEAKYQIHAQAGEQP